MKMLADVVLVVMVLELLGMAVAGPRMGFSRAAGVRAVLPGLCLVLAMRFALGGAGIAAVGACLLGALCCHVADLAGRRPLQPRVAGAHSADG